MARPSGPIPGILCSILIVLTLILAGPAPAQESGSHPTGANDVTIAQPNARIMLHVVSARSGAAGCSQVPALQCQPGIRSFVTEAPLSTPEDPVYYAYVIVAGQKASDGISGVQFGLEYDAVPLRGVDIADWTPCSVMQFATADWPAAGSDILLTWFPDGAGGTAPCPRTEMLVAGYFTLTAYSPDLLNLTERHVDGMLKVADCQNTETVLNPLAAGGIGFGGISGEDPCLVPPPPPPPPVPPGTGSVPSFKPKLLLHAVPLADAPSGDPCFFVAPACGDGQRHFNTEVPLSTVENPEYLVYVILSDPFVDRKLSRLSFQMTYSEGIEVTDWKSCSRSETRSGGWPASGGSIELSWGSCDAFGLWVVGTLTVSARAAGRLELVSPFSLLSCQPPSQSGWRTQPETAVLGFGGASGRDPCFDWRTAAPRVPVQPTTWGAVKALYRS